MPPTATWGARQPDCPVKRGNGALQGSSHTSHPGAYSGHLVRSSLWGAVTVAQPLEPTLSGRLPTPTLQSGLRAAAPSLSQRLPFLLHSGS